MKLDKKYQVEQCVSNDFTRIGLPHVMIDVEKKRAVSTDGTMMVVVPVETDEFDTSGCVSVEMLKMARKVIKGAVVAQCGTKEVVLPNSVKLPRHEIEQKFPQYEQVMPSIKEGDADTHTIYLNAEKLLQLAKALGTKEDDYAVRLTLSTKPGNWEAFVVTGCIKDSAVGFLMPININAEKYSE